MAGGASSLASTASGLLSPVTGLLSPATNAVGIASGLLNPVSGIVSGASGLLSPVTGAVSGTARLLSPVIGAVGGVSGVLSPVTGIVSGATGGLLGSTGSSQAGLVSGLLGGLNLGTVGSTVNNLPLVGPITTNLQSAQPESALIQNVAPTGLSQTQGSVGIEDVPTLEAALGGGKYLTSAGTVLSFPQEAQGMVAGASAGVQGQLSGVTSQLGDVSSQLGGFGQASQLGGATAQLGSVASQLGGLTSSLGGNTNVGEDLEQVARYIQIGGQTVALNSAGQILGLVQNPAQTQNPAVSALEQNPAITYFQSPTDGATSASPASDDGDAMDLVAQAMTGGEQAAGGNGFDDASWKMGGEMEDQRLTTATMSMTGAWSIPPVTASSTEAWLPATTTAEADGEGWGGWVSATALTNGAWSSAATGTASVTSSTMMPTGSAGLS